MRIDPLAARRYDWQLIALSMPYCGWYGGVGQGAVLRCAIMDFRCRPGQPNMEGCFV